MYMNNKQCLNIIKELQEILDTGGKCITDPTQGICYNLTKGTPITQLQYYSETWEFFSGDSWFPVNDVNSIYNVIDQYHYLGKWEGKQLELRLSLVTHLLKCYKNHYIENFS